MKYRKKPVVEGMGFKTALPLPKDKAELLENHKLIQIHNDGFKASQRHVTVHKDGDIEIWFSVSKMPLMRRLMCKPLPWCLEEHGNVVPGSDVVSMFTRCTVCGKIWR